MQDFGYTFPFYMCPCYTNVVQMTPARQLSLLVNDLRHNHYCPYCEVAYDLCPDCLRQLRCFPPDSVWAVRCVFCERVCVKSPECVFTLRKLRVLCCSDEESTK